jgi:hypothetical protein
MHQNSGPPVVSFYAGTDLELVAYYKGLIWGALFLSFVGPSLLWLVPRRFASEPALSAMFGLFVGFAGSALLVRIVSPTDPRVRVYPIDPKYFIFAGIVAGTVAGYIRFVFSGPKRSETPAHQKHYFVVEGVLAWLFVSQFYAFWGLSRAGNVSDLGPIQQGFTVAALLWSWLCPWVLSRRRPSTLVRSIMWAILIGLVVSKVLGLCLGGLCLVLMLPGGFELWTTGYLGEAGQINLFLAFGPALIWGLIMGFRRWQFLQAEKQYSLSTSDC